VIVGKGAEPAFSGEYYDFWGMVFMFVSGVRRLYTGLRMSLSRVAGG